MLRMPSLAVTSAAAAIALAAGSFDARAETPAAAEAHAVVVKAEAALQGFRSDPQHGSLVAAMRQGHAVLIVPEYVRAGLGIGGAAGTGVLLRKEGTAGRWSAPAFFDLRSATLGLQIGYQKVDLVVVIANAATLDAMLKGDFSLSADAGYQAGTTSAGADASTTTSFGDTGMLAFSRGEGAYAGATIGGAQLNANEDLNQGYYGAGATPSRILVSPGLNNADADRLRGSLSTFAGSASRQ